jgi:4-amino-4-deoxy-L-arabinose transferase-like glycosyltransferase
MTRNQTIILYCLIFISFFAPLGWTPLFDLDEGAFSEATREMLKSGDYITTYLNGNLRFDKPILIYWLQLISIKTFGISEFSLRLPSAIASTIWAYLIYNFTKLYFDKTKAFYVVIFFVSALQINIIAKAAIADALLNMFITATMFSIYKFYQNKEPKYIYLTFLFMGFGVLTKGPVAIMIPFIVSFLFFGYKKEIKLWFKTIFNPIGIVIFLVVALPWYLLEYQAQGQLFIDGFFIKHNLSRFDSSLEHHKGNIFYFIPVLLLGFTPFTNFALKAIYKAKSYLKDDLKLFLFIWFAFVFIFFSFSGTKLPHYIIYGYTPLFILSGILVQNDIKRLRVLISLVFVLVLFLVFPDIVYATKDTIHNRFAKLTVENIYNGFGLDYHIYLGIAIIVAIIIYLKKLQTNSFIISMAFISSISVNFIIMPAYGALMQQPIKEIALLAKHKGYKDIIMYKITNPTFNVYYDGLVRKDTPPKSGDIVFTNGINIKHFPNKEILYQKNAFGLIKIK